MIDIMFFLLASFMMVSLSQVHVKGIKLNLPTGLMGQTQSRREYVALSVDKDGEIYYDKLKVEPNDIYQRLLNVHSISPGAKIFIRGDRDAYHGDILRLIEQVRAAGFYKIAFEVKSPSLPTQASP
ncbi:MAG: biopolymer transporter ExbD [Verrucomicrobiota bacterium]|nr:biopolymer transporter ExbD [Verrucomicrobiota bacterium]